MPIDFSQSVGIYFFICYDIKTYNDFLNFLIKAMNKNYIGVVTRTENDNLCLKQVNISKEHTDLLAKLQDMCNNPNRTLLDMQNEFVRTFTKKEFFYLCLPYSYSSSYIDGINYPNCLTFEEYQTKIEKKRTTLSKDGIKRSAEQIEKRLSEYKEELKNSYYNNCKRYIDGYNFSKTSSSIKSQSNTVMHSTEDIGWTSYEYKVNEDITISIRTNFGYGSSSYFFLNLRYKGVDILPYSSIVKYYKANIIELRRYTRRYSMFRDSWNVAFDFVVETANTAKNAPEFFVKKWITNELTEMISGLRFIAQNPEAAINSFINNKNNDILNGFYYNVRNIWETEIKDYGVYKNEMRLAFKAEKITGALLLLEKLQPLTGLSSTIADSIDEIKRINKCLSPELERQIIKIQNDIKIHKQHLMSLEETLTTLEEKAVPHNKRIAELQEGKLSYEKADIMKEYMKENPEYASLCPKIDDIKTKIAETKTHIRKREGFEDCLTECMERIQTYVLAA